MMGKVKRVTCNRKDAIFKAKRLQNQNIWMSITMIVLMGGFGILAAGAGLFMVLMGLFMGSTAGGSSGIMLLFVGILMLIPGILMPYMMFARTPVMIFRKGFFVGFMNPNHMLNQTVPVIPWSQVKKVMVTKNPMIQTSYGTLSIQTKDDKSHVIAQTPDALEAMNLLYKIIPNKCEDTLKEYLIDCPEFTYHPDATGTFSRSYSQGQWRFLLIFLILAPMSLMGLMFLPMGVAGMITALVTGAIFFGIAFGMLPIFIWRYKKTVLWGAKIEDDGSIKVKKNIFSRLFLRQLEVIPPDAIIGVKRTLTHLGMTDRAMVKLADGKEYDTEFDIFKDAVEKAHYSRNCDIARNGQGHPSDDFKLVRISRVKLIIWQLCTIGPYLILVFLGGLLLPSSGAYMLIVMVVVIVLFTLVVTIGLPIFLIFTLVYSARVQRLSMTNVSIQPGKVMITDAQANDEVLDIKDITEVVEVRGRFINYAKIETEDDTYEIPIHRYSAVKAHFDNKGIMKEDSEEDALFGPGGNLSVRAFSEEEYISSGTHSKSGAKKIKISSKIPSADGKGKKKKAPPRPKGKGKLWFEEDEETVKKRKIVQLKMAGIFGGVGFGFGLLPLIMIPFMNDISCTVWIVIWAGLCLLIFGLITAIFLWTAWRAQPNKFYETGVEAITPFSSKWFFYPYGRYQMVTEGKTKLQGEYYTLMPKMQGARMITLSKTIPNVDRYTEMIKKRVNRPEYETMPEEGLNDLRKSNRGVEPLVFLVVNSIIAAVCFATVIVLGIIGLGDYSGGDALMFSIISPMMSGIVVFLVLSMFFYAIIKRGRQRKGSTKWYRALTISTIIILIVSVLFAFGGSIFGIMNMDPEYEAHHRDVNDIRDLYSGNYIGENLYWNGTIDVREELVIVNSTLKIGQGNGKCGIWVHPEGSLTLINVDVIPVNSFGSPASSSSDLAVEVHGNLYLEDCSFVKLRPGFKMNADGGLEIYSDDSKEVKIIRCTIGSCYQNGLLISGSHAEISDCYFIDIDDDAIEVQWSNVTIDGCTFESVNYGIVAFNSNINVNDSGFFNTTYGVNVDMSNLSVTNCTFRNIWNTGITYEEGTFYQKGNAFIACEDDIDQGSNRLMMKLCYFGSPPSCLAISVVGMGAAMGTMWFMDKRPWNKKKKKK